MIAPFTRSGLLTLSIMLVGCSAGPQHKPQAQQQYEEPLFTAERLLPPDYKDSWDKLDPWEGMNRRIYNFNYHFDRLIFLPVTRGYKLVVPSFARTGITNFFNNFRDVNTMLNSVLQFSPEKFAQSTSRVLVNSTIGLFGLIDVATMMDVPRPVEDFGQTLGVWGVGQGPYVVIPLLGPSNVRDGIGMLPDFYVQTLVQGEALARPLRKTIFLFNAIDTRGKTAFRYHETGSAYEYDLVRWLYSLKRDLDVEK